MSNISLRTKILSAYGLVIVLILSILLIGFSQFRRIAYRLDVIQLAYLPISFEINTLSSFYHLAESFDVEVLYANRANSFLINSVTVTNPRILRQRLTGVLLSSEQQMRQAGITTAAWDRIKSYVELLLIKHQTYEDEINQAVQLTRTAGKDEVLTKAVQLRQRKQEVLEQMQSLQSQLSLLIHEHIRSTVREERRAVYTTAGLSVVTLLISIIIGLVTIIGLRPLSHLKQAAREIASGDLTKRVPIETHDEVGALAREFNTMADAIMKRDLALREHQQQLLQSQKLAAIGQMASKINHEIRNPLNALSLNVELLKEQMPQTDGNAIFDTILKQIDRLHDITEHYLNLARKPRGDFRDLNVANFLNQVTDLLKPECDAKQITYDLDIPSTLPVLNTNIAWLEQAVINLCRNAMEAVGPHGHWGIRSHTTEQQLLIDIWDHGSGIADDQLPYIFSLFYTTKDKGTGLGLAITQELVRDLGGKLSCQRLALGTQFTISLPV